jgi:hypothetical protein
MKRLHGFLAKSGLLPKPKSERLDEEQVVAKSGLLPTAGPRTVGHRGRLVLDPSGPED